MNKSTILKAKIDLETLLMLIDTSQDIKRTLHIRTKNGEIQLKCKKF